jgi:hypothetical protein
MLPKSDINSGSACPYQQITHRAVVPSPASGGANASIIKCLSNSAVRGRSGRLYLAHHGKDVGGEGVRCLPVGRHALGLCIMLAGIVGYEAKSPRIQEKQANLNIHS